MKNPHLLSRAVASAILASSLFLPAVAPAAPIIYTWASDTGGDWSTAANWNPAEIPGINGTNDTRLDGAAIAKNVTVTSIGDISFSGSAAGKNGIFNALSLTDQAALNITGSLTVQSASGNGGVFRNVVIGRGSTLGVSNSLNVGISNNGAQTSTWNIQGVVNAHDFKGYRGATSAGGFILNINGGTFSISNTFSWGIAGSNGTGVINIASGGTVSIGTMETNWLNSNFAVNFADASGSLTFGYTNWATESAVWDLIHNQRILNAGSQSDDFLVVDNGNGWTVTVIPEPSTVAITGTMLLILGLGKKLTSHKQSAQ